MAEQASYRRAGSRPESLWRKVAGSARHSHKRACGVGAYSTLGSPTDASKRLYGAPRTCSEHCGQLGTWEGGIPGTTQLGTWEGGIPGTNQGPAADWYCQGPTDGPGVHYRVPRALQGPAGPLRTPWLPHPLACPSQPIRARFSHIYPKVSPESGVSSVFSHEAWHSPCFKKRPQSHDLEFPRIRYGPAFSHKE